MSQPPKAVPTPLTRCTSCGRPPDDPRAKPLRRGRCERCYEVWVKARPVGLGASCAVCDDRRLKHLRHFEIGLRANAPGGRWVVLCHNCTAVAESLQPPPRSIDGLKMRLYRDRRWGDRRAAAVGGASGRPDGIERRGGDRRDPGRRAADAIELAEETEASPAAEIEPAAARAPSASAQGGATASIVARAPEEPEARDEEILIDSVIELIAEYEQISESQLADIAEVTGIHEKI